MIENSTERLAAVLLVIMISFGLWISEDWEQIAYAEAIEYGENNSTKMMQ